MEFLIKISWLTNWSIKVASAFLGLLAFLLMNLFRDSSPSEAAFLGGFMAVIAYEVLIGLYVWFTGQEKR